MTRLLNFDYAYPTPKGVTVKQLAYGLGAAAAIVVACIAWHRAGRSLTPRGDSSSRPSPDRGRASRPRRRWHEALTPADERTTGDARLVAWSFLSALVVGVAEGRHAANRPCWRWAWRGPSASGERSRRGGDEGAVVLLGC